MIHQQHDNFHVYHILYYPLEAPVVPFPPHQFFGEYGEQDKKGASSVISLIFCCAPNFTSLPPTTIPLISVRKIGSFGIYISLIPRNDKKMGAIVTEAEKV